MYYFSKIPTLLFMLILFYSCQSNDIEKKVIESENNINTPESVKKLFTPVNSSSSGITFNNINQENNQYNFYNYEYYYNGGGVATADFNNDGLEDIFFTANMSPNKLYINKGNLQFQDATETANVNHTGSDWCTGVTILDINNDGWQDIFVSRSGWFDGEYKKLLRNLLYINNKDLTFSEKGIEYGFTDLSNTTQACFFDMDNDGDLDVYFLNHPTNFKTSKLGEDGVLRNFVEKDNAFTDKLFINNNNVFTDESKKRGIENYAHGLGISSADFNGDGYTDLYISNDYTEPDFLFINQKNGTFKDESQQQLKHMSKFSMGVDVADINNDGLQDIINLEMLGSDNYSKKINMASMNPKLYWGTVKGGKHYQNMQNSLQLNNGNNTFSEISWLSGVAETDWSWCPLFADFDNDGYKDLLITNGYKRDMLNKDFKASSKDIFKGKDLAFNDFKMHIPSTKKANFIFKNNGDLSFSDQSEKWFDGVQINSNGAAYADFDNDGDLDIVINNLNEKALLYENNNINNNNFIRFNILKNTNFDFAATVEILDEGSYQKAELSSVKGYLSTSEKTVHFGLEKNEQISSVLVTWSNGKTTLLKDLEINSTTTVEYEKSKFTKIKSKENKLLMKDVTAEIKIGYKHQEKEFNDYKREILLPHKLSQEGPFIDVADVNNDGLEDFFVGNGNGYAGELFLQTASGQFKKSKQQSFETDKNSEDIGVLFFDYDSDGDQDLYVVSGSNEVALDNSAMLDRLYQNDGKGNFTKTKGIIPDIQASGSCVKSADFDNDGDLDLFVGGFQLPGQYPKAGRSSLLINQNGKFENLISEIAPELEYVGMVKDAVFSDLNNDKKIDIVVTGQWMAVEVFINNGTVLEKKSKEFKTDKNIGWFNSLLVEDINNDGYQDIIAGNLGLNTKHKATIDEPFRIYADDFDGNGTNDIVLGYYSDGVCYPVRGKQCSSEQVPSINQKIPTYDQFGMSNIFQVYGKEALESSTHFDATYFQSTVLYSKGGENFTFEALSNECQFAPTNSILSVDIEKDIENEFLLAGNHYPVEVETGRYDAHVGNFLQNKNGKLKDIKQTGFFIDSDVRCMKKIKIKDQDFIIISSNRSNLRVLRL